MPPLAALVVIASDGPSPMTGLFTGLAGPAWPGGFQTEDARPDSRPTDRAATVEDLDVKDGSAPTGRVVAGPVHRGGA